MIGFDHPDDRTIAYVRYIPCEEETDRMRVKGNIIQYFKKIINISDRLDWIRSHHPNFLYSSPKYDQPFSTLPNTEIKSHLLPEKKKTILEHDTIEYDISPEYRALKKDAHDFCEYLADKSGISTDFFGFTGSLLGGLVTPNSDLDIIVYGFYNSLKIREILRDLLQTDDPQAEIRRYTLNEFKILFNQRAQGSPIQFYDFIKYESRKLHQGKFRNRDFFIRFMEFPTREEYAKFNHFLKQQIRILGRIRISGEVRGDEFWWTTPARIEPANVRCIKSEISKDKWQIMNQFELDPTQIHQTFTLRGRFIENVRLLEHFTAEGTLELVIPVKNSPYLQLALGSDPRDFLIQN